MIFEVICGNFSLRDALAGMKPANMLLNVCGSKASHPRRTVMRKALCRTVLAALAFSLWSFPAFAQSGCSSTNYGNGFTCVQETSSFNGGTTNHSVSATLPSAVTARDTILVAAEAAYPQLGESVGSVTDSLGNSFTAIPSSVNTHCAHYIEWFYASNVIGGLDTVTANFTGYANGGGGTVAPMEWNGVGGFDVAGLDGNSGCPYSNLVTTSDIVTGNEVDLILAFFVDTSGAGSITAGNGFGLINSFLGAADHGIEAQSVNSTATYSASFTLGGPVNWETNIVAFKSSSSGGGSGATCSNTSFGNGFSCVQKASSANGGTTNNSVSADLVSNVTSGNTIIVAADAAFQSLGETVSSVTDSLGNIYTSIPGSVNTHCVHYIEWFYSPHVVGGTDTITANFTGYSNGGGGTVVAMEWSGVGTFDRAGTDGNTGCPYSSTVNTSTINTTNADDLVLAFFADTSGAQTVAAGSGYSLIDSLVGGEDHGVEAETVSSTGSYSASFTLGASVNWEANIASFKSNGGVLPTLTSIAVTPLNPSVSAQTAQQFEATGTYSDGTVQNLTNIATWSSSYTTVATINTGGLAQGIGPGQTTIEASLGGVNGSTTLNVTAAITGCSFTNYGNGFTCIQKASNFNGGTYNASVSATLPSSVTSGDTILVAAEAGFAILGEQISSVTDSLGNSYSAIPGSLNTHCAHSIEWFYASNVLGGADTVTVNFSGYAKGGGGTVVAIEWSGVGAVDTSGVDGNSACPWSSTVTTSAITTNNADDLILAFFVDTSGALSVAPGSGYAIVDSFVGAADRGVEAQSVATTGTYSASFTLGSSVNWEANIVAFEAGRATGPPPTLVSIAVTPTSPSIDADNALQFTATGTYSDGSMRNVTDAVTWSSSLIGVATISSTGLAVGVAPGQTTIEAVSGTINNSVTLTVAADCSNTSFGNGFTCIQKSSMFNGGTSNKAVSAALPTSVTAGDAILVAVEAAFPALGEEISSVTDTLGNNYTAVANSLNTGCAHAIEWFYASDVLGGTDTVTANFSGYANGGGGTVIAMEWSGVGGLDVAGIDGNSPACPWSSTVTTAAIATTNADDLILAFFVDTSGAQTVAAGSGYLIIDSFVGAADHGVEAQSVSSTGSYSGSFTLGSSVNWEADIVSFKAGGSSGPPPTLISIEVTPTSPSMNAGNTLQFTATGTYSDGSKRNVTNAVTWSSSSQGVATINSSGLADGVGPGQTTIEAASAAINNSVTLTVTADCSSTSFGNGFTCIQKASNFNGGTSNSSVSATLPSNVTVGNTILVATEAAIPSEGEVVSSVTDSLGNTYTAIAGSVNTDCAHYIEWFYASNVIGGADTVTANFSGYAGGGGGTVAAMEWSGVGTLDVAGPDGNAGCPYSSAVTTSPITTTYTNDLVLAFFVDTAGAGSIAASGGYTLIDSLLAAADHGVEAQSVSSIGSYSALFALGASVNWEADIVAFKPTGR